MSAPAWRSECVDSLAAFVAREYGEDPATASATAEAVVLPTDEADRALRDLEVVSEHRVLVVGSNFGLLALAALALVGHEDRVTIVESDGLAARQVRSLLASFDVGRADVRSDSDDLETRAYDRVLVSGCGSALHASHIGALVEGGRLMAGFGGQLACRTLRAALHAGVLKGGFAADYDALFPTRAVKIGGQQLNARPAGPIIDTAPAGQEIDGGHARMPGTGRPVPLTPDHLRRSSDYLWYLQLRLGGCRAVWNPTDGTLTRLETEQDDDWIVFEANGPTVTVQHMVRSALPHRIVHHYHMWQNLGRPTTSRYRYRASGAQQAIHMSDPAGIDEQVWCQGPVPKPSARP